MTQRTSDPAQSRAVTKAMHVFEVASAIRTERSITAEALYDRFRERLSPGVFALVVGRIVKRGGAGIIGDHLVWFDREEAV